MDLSDRMDLIEQVAIVGGVLILLGWALYKLRKGRPVRWPGSGTERHMRSLERLVLSPQHSLHLIQLGGRTLLVSASPSGCSVLEREEPGR